MQVLLALIALFGFFTLIVNRSEVVSEYGATGLMLLSIALHIALLIGIQLRKQWARWATAGLYTCATLVTLAPMLTRSQGAELAGNVLGAALVLLLLGRFALGAPARRYFAANGQ